MNTKTLITTAAIAIMASTAPALATDMEKTSYGSKKMGMVHFKSKKETTTEANTVSNTADYSDPSIIEPAAGGMEVETTKTIMEEKTSLQQSIQLPRK